MQAPHSTSSTPGADAQASRPTSLPTWLAIASVFAGMACFRLLDWEQHYLASALSAALSVVLLASTRRLVASMTRHLLRVTAVTTLLLTLAAAWIWYSNHFPADVPVATTVR